MVDLQFGSSMDMYILYYLACMLPLVERCVLITNSMSQEWKLFYRPGKNKKIVAFLTPMGNSK
jgi:hypothetical protein